MKVFLDDVLALHPTFCTESLLGGSDLMFCFSEKKRCAASVTCMTGEGLRDVFL